MQARKVYHGILFVGLVGTLGYFGYRHLTMERDERIEEALIERAQEQSEVGEGVRSVPKPVERIDPPEEPVVPEVVGTEGESGNGVEKPEPEIIVKAPPLPPARVASDDPKRAEKAAGVVLPELAPAPQEKGLSAGSPVFLRIFKAERLLEFWIYHQGDRRFRLFKTYPIAAMSGRLGPKLEEGDFQAPEGFYYVGPGRMNPLSSFHLSFDIGYPNAFDQAHGRSGTFIMVHGSDLSAGCFAMTDYGVEEIYSLAGSALNGGQKFFRVHVFPFRMTDAAMVEAQGHGWYEFWKNLREGFLHFEENGIPPNVSVENKRYVFSEASL